MQTLPLVLLMALMILISPMPSILTLSLELTLTHARHPTPPRRDPDPHLYSSTSALPPRRHLRGAATLASVLGCLRPGLGSVLYPILARWAVRTAWSAKTKAQS